MADLDFDAALEAARAAGQPIEQILADLEALLDYRKYHKAEYFEPYEKQWEFIGLGAKAKKERGLFAGNQLGKSEVGAFETAAHLTGQYPQNWPGYQFQRPIDTWAAGVSTKATQDVSQTKLFGLPGQADEEGTGFVPKDCILATKSRRNAGADVMESAQIRHFTNGVEDGISTIAFKSYEQGRLEFQGKTLDLCWTDEEPPADIYSECMARIDARRDAMSITTFTPLKGRTPVVLKFQAASHESPYAMVTIRMLDVPWKTAEDVVAAKHRYPRHEWEARINGVPMLGEGREFITPREMLFWTPPVDIPSYWRKLWGVDFGIAHPFAAVLSLWDPETDILYLYRTYRATGAIPLVHAQAIREIAADVPVAWPHDGWARDKGSGIVLAKQYKALGLNMLATHAHFANGDGTGGFSTEAAIQEMHQRISSSKFRVNRDLEDWFGEYEEYHRENGQLVKVRDDLLSATQKVIMMRRYARAVPIIGGSASYVANPAARGPKPTRARPVNPWTGQPVQM